MPGLQIPTINHRSDEFIFVVYQTIPLQTRTNVRTDLDFMFGFQLHLYDFRSHVSAIDGPDRASLSGICIF